MDRKVMYGISPKVLWLRDDGSKCEGCPYHDFYLRESSRRGQKSE